jgi:hypothetical protein
MIPEDKKNQIIQTAKLKDIVEEFITLKKSGASMIGECPSCGKSGKNKGMSFNFNKDIFKCFSCSTGGKGAVDFLLKTQNLNYPQALDLLANRYNIDISENKVTRNKRKNQKYFYEKQLEESGLNLPDIKATINEDGDAKLVREVNIFKRGTVDQYYKVQPGTGDDMLIYYYDLDGNPVMYKPKKKDKYEPFFRVRFQNPEMHKSRTGQPMKYYSPAGSGSHLYIPEKIRKLYQHSRKIKTLFIQEGEKKAEKACKHGINSVGIMGIHNMGSHNTLPPELQLLIQRCEVEEVVFLLDSDWQNISENLKIGDRADKRPLSFFYAIKNYKEYMLTLRNLNINLEIYFGASKSKIYKGVDDLLHLGLRNKENELIKDIDYAKNEKSGQGELVVIHKITSLTDHQIKDFWKLNVSEEFANHHKDILEKIPEFKIGKLKFTFKDGKFTLAEPILPEEKYWDTEETKSGKEKHSFNYAKSFNFLRNRGFGKMSVDGVWKYIRWQKNIVEEIDRIHIKDYVMETTRTIASESVQNLLYQGGHFYLGAHTLENLLPFEIKFEKTTKESQNIHFKNCTWQISDKIKEVASNQRVETVWQDKIKDFEAKLINEPLIEFFNAENGYNIKLSTEGKRCHFLQFLINTSNFIWRDKMKGEKIDKSCIEEQNIQLLNKLTAIGYLIHRFKNPSSAKAVVCMDGKLSEVGDSNGRSGKSLMGKAIEHLVPQVYIPAKTKNLTDDQFLYDEVSVKTENIFLDDVRANFDFEHFFPLITGKLTVNKKGGIRYTIPEEFTPKLLITTNHAINGDGSSFKDRQHICVFSDYYNDNHKPQDDFNCLFFQEWDNNQWNLFYNLGALCLNLYFKHGLVNAPSKTIELRRLRQQMGESFLQWADEFYAPSYNEGVETNLGRSLIRHELYTDFTNKYKTASKYTTPTKFMKCMKFYCKYKGYSLNPESSNDEGYVIDDFKQQYPKRTFIGKSIKRNGTEYITIISKIEELTENPF